MSVKTQKFQKVLIITIINTKLIYIFFKTRAEYFVKQFGSSVLDAFLISIPCMRLGVTHRHPCTRIMAYLSLALYFETTRVDVMSTPLYWHSAPSPIFVAGGQLTVSSIVRFDALCVYGLLLRHVCLFFPAC